MADTVFIPDDGIGQVLAFMIAASGFWDGKKIRLFSNNVVVSDSTILADLTESAWSGYAAHTIAAASFGAVVIGAHIASSSYPNVTFTRTVAGAAANNYGAYITDAANTHLEAVWNFTTRPLTVTGVGDNIVLASQAATVQSAN